MSWFASSIFTSFCKYRGFHSIIMHMHNIYTCLHFEIDICKIYTKRKFSLSINRVIVAAASSIIKAILLSFFSQQIARGRS